MLSLKDFNLREQVLSIFETHKIMRLPDIIYTLELYKFRTREDILDILGKEYPDEVFMSFDHIDREDTFLDFEKKYNVLVNRTSPKNVDVLYPVFSEIPKNSILLNLGKYEIRFVAITRLNFEYLFTPDYKPVYDPDILFKRILLEAIDLHATDLHFTVKHNDLIPSYPIEYRRDGILIPMNLFTLDQQMNKDIIYRLIERRTDSNSLDIAQSSGVIASSEDIFQDGKIELRIAANKVKDGYRCVLRIQQKTTVSMKISELGFPERVQQDISTLASKRSGITFITGAIRTGKNTTAFAMANEMIESDNISLISYDSPVEVLMAFPQVDYMEDPERLLNCVRLAKKQDINVCFLNEIPSKQVAFAVQDLANSSIYVITTMHLDRIWHLPYRLYEYYGEGYKDVISQINGCINQKMFGVVCPHCRKEVLVSSLSDVRKQQFLSERGINTVYASEGCSVCRDELTGKFGTIKGRNQPYVEHLLFSDDFKSSLLACDHAWQMEAKIKEAVKKQATSLEDYMTQGIREGSLSVDALDYIL